MRTTQLFSGLVLGTLLVAPVCGWAETPAAITGYAGYASRQVFRGVERAGASSQLAADFVHERFRVGGWGNLPFSRDGTREFDLNAGYSWPATDQVAIEAMVTQFWYGQTPAGGTRHSLEAGLTATLAPIEGLTPKLGYAHDFRLRSDNLQLTLTHGFALTQWGTFLDFDVFTGWSTGKNWRPDAIGVRRQDSYGYWGAEARLPYRVGPHSTVVAGLHFADNFGLSPVDGPAGRSTRGNWWFSLGVSLDF